MFAGFTTRQVRANGITVHVCCGGAGPPVLLLHGYPETHVMWHQVAPVLARRFTVVCPDLRGYGDSGKPPGGPEHEGYSKRAMAQDQVAVMAALGFGRFAWPCQSQLAPQFSFDLAPAFSGAGWEFSFDLAPP